MKENAELIPAFFQKENYKGLIVNYNDIMLTGDK